MLTIPQHVPREVMDYIEANGLYKDSMVSNSDDKGKTADADSSSAPASASSSSSSS